MPEVLTTKEKARGGSLQMGKADIMLKITDYLLQEQLISPAEKIELVNLIRGDEISW